MGKGMEAKINKTQTGVYDPIRFITIMSGRAAMRQRLDPEDIRQECLKRYLTYKHKIDLDGYRAQAYLIRLIHNTITAYKKKCVNNDEHLEDMLTLPEALMQQGSEASVVHSDLVEKLLNNLTDRERYFVIRLYGIGCVQMTMGELAQATTTTHRNVSMMAQKALRIMRRSLERESGEVKKQAMRHRGRLPLKDKQTQTAIVEHYLRAPKTWRFICQKHDVKRCALYNYVAKYKKERRMGK
jgi:DNA-directed RNA polymerase specialized sigma24 family protein